MNYTNSRFQTTEGAPIDPIARSRALAGPLPKTFGTATLLQDGEEVVFEGDRNKMPPWKSPKDSIVERMPMTLS